MKSKKLFDSSGDLVLVIDVISLNCRGSQALEIHLHWS